MDSGFDGTWEIVAGDAKVWNVGLGMYESDAVGQEIITIRTEDDVQDYEVLYGADPVIRMGYRARFDATEWEQYLVRGIEAAPGRDESVAVAEFRERIKADRGTLARTFEVGQPYGMVRLISGDDRTHYRLSRDPSSNEIVHIMLRRLDPDGEQYTSYVFDRDGVVNRIRPFRRVAPSKSEQ